MGWGQPAAFNQIVSYVYAARNTGNGDPGDVFYIRSTDMGRDLQCPVPVEHQRRDHQGAVDAQPFGQRSRHPLRHVVRRDTEGSGQLPALHSDNALLPDASRASPPITA